jgi:hypothetical protein
MVDPHALTYSESDAGMSGHVSALKLCLGKTKLFIVEQNHI